MQLAGRSNPFALIAIVPNSAQRPLKGIVGEMITAGITVCRPGIVDFAQMPGEEFLWRVLVSKQRPIRDSLPYPTQSDLPSLRQWMLGKTAPVSSWLGKDADEAAISIVLTRLIFGVTYPLFHPKEPFDNDIAQKLSEFGRRTAADV
jgi:hypothetical protein